MLFLIIICVRFVYKILKGNGLKRYGVKVDRSLMHDKMKMRTSVNVKVHPRSIKHGVVVKVI